MRDVIQKIIATESEAKLIVEEARAEADRILSEAEKKGKSIVDRARQEAIAEGERILCAAIEEAGEEKKRRLAHAAVEINREVQLSETAREWAVQGVVRCVCGLA